MNEYPFTIKHIYISPKHNYYGSPKDQPKDHPSQEVDTVECVAGKGLEGDRFFDIREDFIGQVSFFSWEVYQELQKSFAATPVAVCRRNIITCGINLNDLIGEEFRIGETTFLGTEHCAPCRWMDAMFGAGALKFLKGRGGLRAKVVSSGPLKQGENVLQCAKDLDLSCIAQPLKRPELP